MVRILLAWVVMFQFTLSFAHDTLISTAIPYATGMVHLNVDNDTVTFSNGLKIFSLVFEYPKQIPEEKTWCGGIAFGCTSGGVAYKRDPSLVTRWVGGQKIPLEHFTGKNVADWCETTGNPDTIWGSATNIPSIIYPMDSLLLQVSTTEIARMPVKVVYSSSVPCCDVIRTITTRMYTNSNAILYFLSSPPSNPNMKLQVVSIEIDSSSTEPHGTLGIFKNYVVSGINFKWAIDSLGNGVFDNSTSIAKDASHAVYTSSTKTGKYLKLTSSDQRNSKNSLSNGNDYQAYFSLKGEKVCGISGKGVFVKP
jgi:hypothetical protein